MTLSLHFINPPEDKKRKKRASVAFKLIVGAGVNRYTIRVGGGGAVREGSGGGASSFVACLSHLEGTEERWTTYVPLRRSVV